MKSKSDEAAERSRMEETLKRQATPEARRIADHDKRRKLDQAAEITRGRQRKAEEIDAKLRTDQKLREAKALGEAQKMEIRLEQAQEESKRQFLKQLRSDWGRRLGHYKGARPPYSGKSEWGDLEPEQLLRAATARRPASPGTWVTNFSDWVFDLEHPRRDPAWRDIGRTVEKHLLIKPPAERVRSWLRSVPLQSDGWRILFEDDQTSESQPFLISALKVGHQCLVGKPDLVLEELRTGAIYIVERKASNRPIPTQCWHNVRAQLWAYSQIDDWVNRPSVTLCAEVWRHTTLGRPTDSQVFSWDCGDMRLAAGIQPLFEIYRQAGGS